MEINIKDIKNIVEKAGYKLIINEKKSNIFNF